MFREMRRKQQQLPDDECAAIFERGSSGVLAVTGDDGWPYAVPLSYACRDGSIYFHCAAAGHKLDALRAEPRACFCVVDADEPVPDRFLTRYRSAVAFGRVRELTQEDERRAALLLLAEKYSPGLQQETQAELARSMGRTCVLELRIAHSTAKEAGELMQERRAKQQIG